MISVAFHALMIVGALRAPAQDAKPRSELPLSAPAGWDRQEKDGTLALTPRDLEAGTIYTVLIPGLPQKMGTVRQLLELAKATLGQVGEFKPSNEPVGARTEGGWEFEVVIGTLAKNGKNLMAQGLGLKKGDREGIILILSDSVPTMERYSAPFNTMVRSMDAPKAAPAAAPAAGGVDLVYTIPEGWTATPQAGAVVLSRSNEATRAQFQALNKYQLIILPSQPLKDSLRKTFRDLWDVQFTQSLETSVMPFPMLRRLKSGALLAFDLAAGAKYRDGRDPGGFLEAGLYILARGNRFVPMVALYINRLKELDEPLLKFMESATIPDAGDGPVVPFAASEIAGAWTESSISIASYVRNGQVVGDASLFTGSEFTLNPDGTFKSRFVVARSGKTLVFNDEGKWTVDDLSLNLQGNEKRQYTVYGVGKDPKLGDFLVLSEYYNNNAQINPGDPRGYFQFLTFKKKP
ncbi:MAG TPA: hypothetical protein VEN81_06330 [Planctomycetota bacterium]|nr:hypothetical protein [Planctomycetota bacterium]